MSRQMKYTPGEQKQIPKTFRVGKLGQYELFEITVDELQRHFEHDDFKAVDYVEFCLTRLRRLNKYLECVIEENPDAVSIAKSLDAERAQGLVRGPLHGIPILVKDNIATKDSMQTTAGSWALLDSKVQEDAHVVSRLRQAGAVILGHTNMCEWACVRSELYSTGYSPRGGQVRNPFDLRKSPSGSSSGSAVSVSVNIVPGALGTETDTSIIGPAGANGVVGIKPTVGLTSRTGVIPISENFDSVGCFGRTVADATYCLSAIARPDDKDAFTKSPSRSSTAIRYSDFLATRDALRGARFGLPRTRCWDLAPASCKVVISKVFDALKGAGAEIVDVNFPSIEERVGPEGAWDWERGGLGKSEWTVARIDAYNGINAYLSGLEDTKIKTVEDILHYNRQNDGTEGASPGKLPAFLSGQDTFDKIAVTKGVQDEDYHRALKHIHKQTRENGIDAALQHPLSPDDSPDQSGKLDALLMCDRRGIGQQYAAQAGYPIIIIPIGLDSDGMPVGLSIHQTAWEEAKLIKWASAIEHLWNEVNGRRATPTFRNHLAKNIPIEQFREE